MEEREEEGEEDEEDGDEIASLRKQPHLVWQLAKERQLPYMFNAAASWCAAGVTTMSILIPFSCSTSSSTSTEPRCFCRSAC